MRPIRQLTNQKPFRGRRDDATLYASLELSQATWLVTSLSPGSERMSKYSTPGGDGAALLGRALI
jgi:transposase